MLFDVERLRAEMAEIALKYPPNMVSRTYGGWSLLSSNGSYLDGWGNGKAAYDEGFMDGASMDEKRVALGIKDMTAYCEPTELCRGYFDEMLCGLRDAGFSPFRSRVALLKAGGATTMHRDAPEGTYAVRLHIPIVTNEQCLLETEGQTVHLPADGSGYLVRVDRLHRVVNRSQEDRLHFVAGFWDMQHRTKHHQYTRSSP